MKTNQEILDEFGKKVIDSILDRYYKAIPNIVKEGYKNPTMSHYNDLFNKIEDDKKLVLSKFVLENINSILFDFLNFFEENEEFKLIYEKNGKQINLVEICEMLKAEPLGENGWIKRFSKYADEYEV